jgi:hypothetical protein
MTNTVGDPAYPPYGRASSDGMAVTCWGTTSASRGRVARLVPCGMNHAGFECRVEAHLLFHASKAIATLDFVSHGRVGRPWPVARFTRLSRSAGAATSRRFVRDFVDRGRRAQTLGQLR